MLALIGSLDCSPFTHLSVFSTWNAHLPICPFSFACVWLSCQPLAQISMLTCLLNLFRYPWSFVHFICIDRYFRFLLGWMGLSEPDADEQRLFTSSPAGIFKMSRNALIGDNSILRSLKASRRALEKFLASSSFSFCSESECWKPFQDSSASFWASLKQSDFSKTKRKQKRNNKTTAINKNYTNNKNWAKQQQQQ